MDAAEILWRLRSLARDLVDRVRIPLRLYPRPNRSAYRSFRAMQPGFRCTPIEHHHWDEGGTLADGRWRQRLREKADAILANRLSYFDLRDEFHGEPFNWHRDHSAGIDASVGLSMGLDYRDFNSVGDCKLVWEPNRHHQLVVLARAYVAFADVRYAHKVAELMQSWITANPFGFGMNWRSPLEVGIRLINWVWAIDLIRGADCFEQSAWDDVLESVYLALWDTQRKFSRGSSANNHLIGEAAGVYVAASYFSDLDEAREWRARAKAVLEREILLQTYDDGCTREHAFGYQLFVIQFLTQCVLVGRATGDGFSVRFLDRLHAMHTFLHTITVRTGAIPNMGDRDDGYVLDLGDLPDDPLALLSVGAKLFDDPDLATRDAAETTFWLLGASAITSAAPVTSTDAERGSVAFADSGYFLLANDHGAAADRPVFSALVDCAPLGFGAIAAHGHADCLSLVLNLGDRHVLIDPGTYDYFSHPEWRTYFRRTRAHNTVEIDGQDQSEMLGPFLWGRRAEASIIEWRDDPEFSIITGEHDGYASLTAPVIHRRTVTLNKVAPELIITDRMTTTGSHAAVLHFHVDPHCKVVPVSGNEASISVGQNTLSLSCDSGRLSVRAANDDDMLGWVSDSYHSKSPSACITIEVGLQEPTVVETRIKLI